MGGVVFLRHRGHVRLADTGGDMASHGTGRGLVAGTSVKSTETEREGVFS